MRSRTTAGFRKAFAGLPAAIQERARKDYRRFLRDPWTPSLRLKRVHASLPIYSVRIGKFSRAIGRKDGQGAIEIEIAGEEEKWTCGRKL